MTESFIYSGSDMNHRTFGDESWNSLQSTILAGELSIKDDIYDLDKKDKPTIVQNNSVLGDSYVENDLLNMNIDAIDKDLLVNSGLKIMKTPNRKIVLTPEDEVEQENYLSISTISPPDFLCTSPNSPPTYFFASPNKYDFKINRPNQLLIQMIKDFDNDMKNHAQSTPKEKFDESGYFSMNKSTLTNGINNYDKLNSNKRKLDFPKATVIIDVKKLRAEKNGNSPVDSKANSRSRSPTVMKKSARKAPRPKVRQMKEFFENVNKNNQQSHVKIQEKVPVYQGNIRTKQLKLFYLGNSAFYDQKTLKPLKNSKNFKLYSNKNSPLLLRNQSKKSIAIHSQRPSSCSEFPIESSNKKSDKLNVSNLSTNKSRSTGDLTAKTSKLNVPKKKSDFSSNQYATFVIKPSPKNRRKMSEITRRSSLGFVSSPVKPVEELRKIFSPHTHSNVKQVRKAPGKNTKTFPQIIINKP